MKRKNLYHYLAGLTGHVLEHFDTALFALLAPFIAPLFFPASDPILSLAMTYALHPISLLAKPLGALYFGSLGDRLGRKDALFYSMIGTAILTVSIGFLPEYKTVGIFSPLLLTLVRIGQVFFAAGESAGGALFVLEKGEAKSHTFLSALINSSTILGILFASFSVTLLCAFGKVEELWRLLFFAGGLVGIAALILRAKGEETLLKVKQERPPLLPLLKKYYIPFLHVMIACGFSHVTYTFSFTLLNGFVPIITPLSKEVLQQSSTVLLALDMILLPVFGLFCSRFSKEKVMLFGALFCSLVALPLFSMLPTASLAGVIFIRSILITGGVCFAAPYYAWAVEVLPKKHRYLLLSLASSLGGKIIGGPASALSLLLYRYTGSAATVAIYLVCAGLITSFCLYLRIKRYSPSHVG